MDASIFKVDGTEVILRQDCPDESLAAAVSRDAQRAYEMGYQDALEDVERLRVELIKQCKRTART